MNHLGMYEPIEYSRYQPYRSIDNGISTCMVAAVVVVVVTLLMQSNTRPRNMCMSAAHDAAGAVSGMLATIGNAVSARVASGEAADNDASRMNRGFEVGAATALDADPNSPATEEVKKDNEAMLRKFMASNGTGCVIFFAHWCPHCHALVESLVEVANANAKGPVKFLLVNGDAIASTAVTGDDAVVQLKYYPTILCKTKQGVKQVPSLEEAKKELGLGDAADAPAATAMLSKKVAEEEPVEEEDPFGGMFD
jgi:thiol-disulfide isomerase/thioredoxin